MNRRKVIAVINILLVCAMFIHVGVKMYLHAQHPAYSAPIYLELVNAVYYLIPLAVINAVNIILKKQA